MVDMERVLGEIKRTTYVGLGTFGSTYVGNFLDDFMPGGDVGVGAAQMFAGAGAAALVGERVGNRSTQGLDFDAGEVARHAAYGAGGAGFAELADAVNNDALTQNQMVEVRTRSNASEENQSDESSVQREELSVDV